MLKIDAPIAFSILDLMFELKKLGFQAQEENDKRQVWNLGKQLEGGREILVEFHFDTGLNLSYTNPQAVDFDTLFAHTNADQAFEFVKKHLTKH